MKSELTAAPLEWGWPAQFSALRLNRRSDRRKAERADGARTRPDPQTPGHRGDEWFEVDLFPAPGHRSGPRFDDTVALPIDAPQRLEAAVRAAEHRLLVLPEPEYLNERAIAYRTRVEQVLREAREAQARLDDGSYGTCLTCDKPISLALLIERPWRRSCVYCELDV